MFPLCNLSDSMIQLLSECEARKVSKALGLPDEYIL